MPYSTGWCKNDIGMYILLIAATLPFLCGNIEFIKFTVLYKSTDIYVTFFNYQLCFHHPVENASISSIVSWHTFSTEAKKSSSFLGLELPGGKIPFKQ